MRSRITLLLMLCILVIAATTAASVPNVINYQGFLTDAEDNPRDTTVAMTFTIYDDSIGVGDVWTESFTDVFVEEGRFRLLLGLTNPMLESVFSGPDRYLGIIVGNDPEIIPRARLVAVPYALRATVGGGWIDTGAVVHLVEAGDDVGIGTSNPSSKLEVEGNVEADGFTINGAPVGTSTDTYWSADGGNIYYNSGNVGIGTSSPNQKLDVDGTAEVSSLLAVGAADDSVLIDPTNDIALSATNDLGDQTISITSSDLGGVINVSATDVAKGTVRTIEVAPGDSVVLRVTEANGDEVILITADPSGGRLFVSATDVAKGIGRTIEIAPSDSVVLRAVEADGDEVIRITADPTGGALFVSVTDVAKGDSRGIVGQIVINTDGIFVIDETTSDTSVAITIDGTIETDGQLAVGEDNVATGDSSSVSGGHDNSATNTGANVAGGGSNTASGLYATVGGGYDNLASGDYSTVSGGQRIGENGSGEESFVGGGWVNSAGGLRSVVCGGWYNRADDTCSFCGGGQANHAQGHHSVVVGGTSNTAIKNWSAIVGGHTNTNDGTLGFIGGGELNEMSGAGAAISGGRQNKARGSLAFIGAGGGWSAADSQLAAGNYSMIVGGRANQARADYSFASGRRAIVDSTHLGAFLWADSTDVDFTSAAICEFAARSTGGVRFVTAVDGSGTPTAGVTVAAGGSSWSTISDRDAKENFRKVDYERILRRLSQIDIATWNYKTQGASIRHIGPVAQDFMAAFEVGEDEKRITTIDADGVALAAIQGLYRRNQQQADEIEQLKKQLEEVMTVLKEVTQ